jgi:glucose-1-phosphate cytidylyltransferase
MIEIGGKPILWHLMKIYSAHGITEFIVCCGYKGYIVKEYFANYFLHMSDVTFDMNNNKMKVHQQNAEPWTVTLVDTGEDTQTGGRLKRVASYLKDEKASLVEKENTWVLTSDNKVIWLIGKRADDRFKVTKVTKSILKVII